jgi:hypothetical protein
VIVLIIFGRNLSSGAFASIVLIGMGIGFWSLVASARQRFGLRSSRLEDPVNGKNEDSSPNSRSA